MVNINDDLAKAIRSMTRTMKLEFEAGSYKEIQKPFHIIREPIIKLAIFL